MTKRLLSYSEVSTALDCQARHAFRYTGQLTRGDALEPRTHHLRLREGRAWGRAWAALHGTHDATPHARYAAGLDALDQALREDEQQQHDAGVLLTDEAADVRNRLADILWHYTLTAKPMRLFAPELELLVPIPSRTGRRVSSRYMLHGFLDGLVDQDDRLWIAEAKLRTRLTSYEQVVLGRQYRIYAWGAERVLEREIAGVIVDERWNEAPKPARMVKGRKRGEGMVPSHAKDQLTTADAYAAVCAEAGVEADPDTLAALGAREWQRRHTVVFRRAEIEEAGRELVSAGRLIHALDEGDLWPLRNPSPARCPGCAFNGICTDPSDDELIDLNFERVVPKRARQPEPLEAAA